MPGGLYSPSAGDVLTAANAIDFWSKQVVIICTSATRPASPREGMHIYETDTDKRYYYTTTWVEITTGGLLLHLRDEKAANTAGGTFTSGAWQTRTLNVEKSDTIGSTLAANQFTLPAGTYWCDAYAIGQQVNGHKARLYNISDGADTLIGSTGYAVNSIAINNPSFVTGLFTIAGAKTFELQHRCVTTVATAGFGLAANLDSKVEIYSEVLIRTA